jgi:phenylpropionate dioxygenase-like ring-hydroxylating dioxygenase large terminal subunit
VVWRGHSGALGTAPRSCPHLDWDLTEATVAGDELVCPGHGWSFDCAGRAFKRNEFGREDDKGRITTLRVSDSSDGEVEVL